MTDYGEKTADPNVFACYFCEKRVEGKVPPGAWVKSVVSPHYRYVCTPCRTGSPAKPKDDFYRCLVCDKNTEIPEVARSYWRHDPGSRIQLFVDGPKYCGFCDSCAADRLAQRETIARRRLTAERNLGQPQFQMARVHELQLAYEGERDSEGALRYDRPAAIERAVGLEMLVADAARSPLFASWLAGNPFGPHSPGWAAFQAWLLLEETIPAESGDKAA
jgi:hypothetical protein